MKIITKILFFIEFFLILLSSNVSSADVLCEQLDFNTETVIGFGSCGESWMTKFVTKPYKDSEIQPFRPTSKFYLTYVLEGYSCGQTETIFALNENTEIEVGILFEMQFLGAALSLHIKDFDTGKNKYSETLQTATNGWIKWMHSPKISMDRAVVVIDNNSNKQNILAIEYLRILNSDNEDVECSVTAPPTDEPTTTTETSTTESTDIPTTTTTTSTETPTTESTDIPTTTTTSIETPTTESTDIPTTTTTETPTTESTDIPTPTTSTETPTTESTDIPTTESTDIPTSTETPTTESTDIPTTTTSTDTSTTESTDIPTTTTTDTPTTSTTESLTTSTESNKLSTTELTTPSLTSSTNEVTTTTTDFLITTTDLTKSPTIPTISTTTESNQNTIEPVTFWMIVSIVFMFLFCFTTLIAFYFCLLNRKYLRIKLKSYNNSILDSKNIINYNNQEKCELPRLVVEHQSNNNNQLWIHGDSAYNNTTSNNILYLNDSDNISTIKNKLKL